MNESLEKRAIEVATKAGEIKVIDQPSLTMANQFILVIKSVRKEIADTFDPIIDQTNKAHREALNQKTKHDEPLRYAETVLKDRAKTYLIEEDRKRKEMEFARFKAEQEKIWLEEEMKRRAEKALKEATEEENKGNFDFAMKIIDTAALEEKKIVEKMPDQIIVPEKPKVEGLSMRDHWTFEIIDESQIPREFLIVDRQKINLIVQQYKEMANISGVRIYCEKIMAARIR